jgi:DNA (cytosine-5)-methyltransferase 1
MDKRPPSIATIETDLTKDLPSFIKISGGNVIYEIYENDSPALKAIKEFMAMYGIRDIKMRMLKIPELLQIMGFPVTYKLIGTKAQQKKYIGNAVETTMAKVLCEALVGKLIEMEIEAA